MCGMGPGWRLNLDRRLETPVWGSNITYTDGTLTFAMYLLGIGFAVLTSLVLTKLVYRNKPIPPFVMELPPYRLPTPRNVLLKLAAARKKGTM